MANHSLDDSLHPLNLSLTQHDTLIESIAKANALVHMVLAVHDLEDISHSTLHDYLWVLSDLIHEASSICECLRPATAGPSAVAM